jgi:hypothetical protein
MCLGDHGSSTKPDSGPSPCIGKPLLLRFGVSLGSASAHNTFHNKKEQNVDTLKEILEKAKLSLEKPDQ